MSGYLLAAALRNLWRNKLHSLINLASLTVGLTVFAFAFTHAKYEFSYNTRWPGAERIHRLVIERQGLPGTPDGSGDILRAVSYEPFKQYFSEDIDRITSIEETSVKLADTDDTFFYRTHAVEANFTDIFKLDVIAGSIEQVLQGPGFIAIEETVAARFPKLMAPGKRIRLEGGDTRNPSVLEYEIAAIFRSPKPVSSAVQFSLLILKHEYSAKLLPLAFPNGNLKVWLTFKPGVSIEALHAQLPDHIDRTVTAYNASLPAGDRISNHHRYRFQPLSSLRFEPVGVETGSRQPDLAQVLTVVMIGLLVLLVGCSNSISLGLAAVMERRRDIGIHKAVGALQENIMAQFLCESVLLALFALIPAWALVQWLFPVFKTLLRLPADFTASTAELMWLSIIAIAAGLASGIYPALVLARVRPQQVLKSGNRGNVRGLQGLRTLLVGTQFCFAVMLMIVTLALFMQLRVLRQQPLGYDPHNLVFLTTFLFAQTPQGITAVMEELSKVPGVEAVSWMGNPPGSSLPVGINAPKFISRGDSATEATVRIDGTGYDAFPMLQIPLVAGRMFDPARDTLDNDGAGSPLPAANERKPVPVMLNRSAARALGFASPEAAVDQLVFNQYMGADGAMSELPYLVVGVVEDSMIASLRRLPGPDAYMLVNSTNILLRYEDSVALSIQQNLADAMQRITGSTSYSNQIAFIEPRIAAEFTIEDNQSRLLLYCAGLAVFLSCIGLYGLAAFTMQRNVKEVGVRKVMGASVSTLVVLYLWRYARPVLIAAIIASPVAIYFVLQWIQRFPYQLQSKWLLPLCLAAGSIVMIIAMFTVAGIVAKAAAAQPVKSLRYE